MRPINSITCILTIAIASLPLLGNSAPIEKTIPNQLKMHWPWELVYFDFPAGSLKGDTSVEIPGVEELRPVQVIESIDSDGQKVDRAWFIATVNKQETKDKKGKVRSSIPPELPIKFHPGKKSEAMINVESEGDFFIINNGIYEFRLRKYAKGLESPLPLEQVKHWMGGARLEGTDKWDGRANFDGNARVTDVEVKHINSGPVFHDFHVVYTFEENEDKGTTEALPVELGKQTYKWEPNVLPKEEVTKKTHTYEAKLRFTAGDPWVEVVERYRLPRDKDIKPWGIHQYTIHWGPVRDDYPNELVDINEGEYWDIDTAMWVRWFEYDAFGGNTDLRIVPAEPRPAQKGRPFALLRPRWNQGPGGAQDFFLTSGGKPPRNARALASAIGRKISDLEKNARNNEEKAKELDKSSADKGLTESEREAMLSQKGKLRADARKWLEKIPAAKEAMKEIGKKVEGKEEQLRKIARNLGMNVTEPGAYSPDHPAAGVVAAYPSKWVGPYGATISAYVRENDRHTRHPLIDGGGGGGNDGDSEDNYYGSRAYAICIGPRSMFQDSGKLNSLVRRHTDWTLTAQINKYILDWERDPAVAGANILMGREKLKRIKADLKAGKDTEETKAVRAFEKDYQAADKEYRALKAIADKPKQLEEQAKELEKSLGGRKKSAQQAQKKQDDIKKQIASLNKRATDQKNSIENLKKKGDQTENLKKAEGQLTKTQKDLKALNGDLEKATVALNEANEKLATARKNAESLKAEAASLKETEEFKTAAKKAKKKPKILSGQDAKLYQLLMGETVDRGKLPDPHLYLASRYQDESVNTTNFGNRRLVLAPFPMTDLFSVGKPYGDAKIAAIGYIYSDLDAWPGWHSGWSPGNPNFHTDKYLATVYAAAAMPDHPHAKEWMQFGKSNFDEDVAKVMIQPDGVGYECPGYSGFSIYLQIKSAEAYLNSGLGNPIATDPLFKKNLTWHRKLITPLHHRLGLRHEAPHGDTHRWTSGVGKNFARVAKFYTESDPDFASEMMGTYQLLKDSGMKMKGDGLFGDIVNKDLDIPAKDPMKMDWSSQHFYGFGGIMRSGFGTDQESFVSVKMGPTSGHYHNDEQAYHYYAGTTPISLDYNASYTPRADHAALHNSMTFGKEGTVMHNARNTPVPSMEQIFGTAYVGAFVDTPAADVIVGERKSSSVTMKPVDPNDHEFSRNYPTRKVDPIVHRRFLTFVKHPENSKLTDYLVVRDETQSTEPGQINIHLLAREVEQKGNLVEAWGQYDKDMLVYFATEEAPEIDQRSYWYYDAWMFGPEEYWYQEGESQKDWENRVQKVANSKGSKTVPHADFQPVHKNAKQGQTKPWLDHIGKTEGKALLPPPGWEGPWRYGEYQKWLRVPVEGNSGTTWVLYPYKRGSEAPKIETIDGGNGVRISLGNEVDEIMVSTEGGVQVKQNGKPTTLLKPGELPPLGEIPRGPDSIYTGQEG